MKTLEQVIEHYKSKSLDGRDLIGLEDFLSEDGLEFNRENILKKLEDDVAFGFEKALDQRGISSLEMYRVVLMWNWIMEEGLEDWEEENYFNYGLPLFIATAEKYGFNIPV
ncbi:hypothetical protein [Paenibacillus chitinolyticus]